MDVSTTLTICQKRSEARHPLGDEVTTIQEPGQRCISEDEQKIAASNPGVEDEIVSTTAIGGVPHGMRMTKVVGIPI